MFDSSTFRLVVENLQEGVIVSDAKGVLIYFNPAAQLLLGAGLTNKSPEEWSKTYGLYESDMKTLLSYTKLPLFRAMNGEVVKNFECSVKNPQSPDGISISANSNPVKNEKGETIGAVVMFSDISSQKREEIELKEKAQLQEKLNKAFMARETKMQELKLENDTLRKQMKL